MVVFLFLISSLLSNRGFVVRSDKQQSVVCPLVGGLPFAMLAKSEDLTFTRPPNVIFSHFVDMLFDTICKGKD